LHRLGPGSHLAAVGQINRRIKDLVAPLDAAVDFDLLPEIGSTATLRRRTTPFSTTATCNPPSLKLIAVRLFANQRQD
jgi:hypothetical protein